jgi:hypothetical protein
MYRVGELGDCFLLTFTAGSARSRVLIDCGSFRNSAKSIARLNEVATDIDKEVAGHPLDVIVGTHQHNDHVSGFVHCEKTFRKIGTQRVWLSWLDDPQDRMATGIGASHNNLKIALHEGGERLRGMRLPKDTKGARALEILEDMMGFYGARKGDKVPPALPADAIKFLKTLGREQPEYLKPGRVLDLPGLPAGTVRVYVLGPPRNSEALYRKDPRTGESYDHALASANFTAERLLAALGNRAGASSRAEDQYPFADTYKCRGISGQTPELARLQKSYNKPDAKWRRIDDDWLSQAESLAIYLDTFTNNSSLVLAFEVVATTPGATSKVLLFAADAQVGNWASWPDVKWERSGVTTDDLLARTVLYKVGHHASHNATLVAALEKMTHPDLSALIPVDKKDPNITKLNGWRMPARNLFKRLADKSENRVLQMDDKNPPRCRLDSPKVKASWKKAGMVPKVTPMYVEVEVKLGYCHIG